MIYELFTNNRETDCILLKPTYPQEKGNIVWRYERMYGDHERIDQNLTDKKI